MSKITSDLLYKLQFSENWQQTRKHWLTRNNRSCNITSKLHPTTNGKCTYSLSLQFISCKCDFDTKSMLTKSSKSCNVLMEKQIRLTIPCGNPFDRKSINNTFYYLQLCSVPWNTNALQCKRFPACSRCAEKKGRADWKTEDFVCINCA